MDTNTINATEKKVLSQEEKADRIENLLSQLKKAHSEKDAKGGKKIRRNLRKLGYYIRKVNADLKAEQELEEQENQE